MISWPIMCMNQFICWNLLNLNPYDLIQVVSNVRNLFDVSKKIDFSIRSLSSFSGIGSAGDTSKIKLELSSESSFRTAVSNEAVI